MAQARGVVSVDAQPEAGGRTKGLKKIYYFGRLCNQFELAEQQCTAKSVHDTVVVEAGNQCLFFGYSTALYKVI